MKFYSIHDKVFNKFGTIIDCPLSNELQSVYSELQGNKEGVKYQAVVDNFYKDNIIEFFKNFFGGLDIQIGICDGYNNILNALEWHKTSEINFAFTDLIILLGDARDIKNGFYDTKNLVAFHIKKGQCFEIYANTLHFCPMAKDGEFFSNLIILPKDTNTLLDKEIDDKRIVKKNKWLICHPECIEYVNTGKVVGLKGKNIKI